MPERVSETGTLTAINLSIIAVAIVLVILAMIWGARLKRKRAAADAIEKERVEETGGNLPAAAAAQRPLDDSAATDLPRRADEAGRTPPAPVAPAPPPIADTPVVATPERASERAPIADAPVATASAFEAPSASEAGPTPAHGSSSSADADAPVTQLKGLGPKVAARLAELGITNVGQLAALDEGAAAELDAQLGAFKGRMARDRWIDQARLLAAGDRAGFETVFGKL